jgi:hypothetical protein
MKRIYLLLLLAFSSIMAMAQNGGGADINVDINKTGGNAGGFPWLWVIGAIVFIVLLVALLGWPRNRQSGRKRRQYTGLVTL